MITTLGDDFVEEMNFILEEQHAALCRAARRFSQADRFMEILVAVDDDPGKTERQTTRKAFVDYFGDDPAGRSTCHSQSR